MILGDLIPAFEGISRKIIPNAVPAVDCAVFFTYAPTAVVVGFIASFIGGIIGMLILGAIGGVLIIKTKYLTRSKSPTAIPIRMIRAIANSSTLTALSMLFFILLFITIYLFLRSSSLITLS